MKEIGFLILSLITILQCAQAQSGLSLSPQIPAANWPTAPYGYPYPNAWITGSSGATPSSGFNNAIYDAATDRTFFSAPFSVGFTTGISGSVPTILVAWSNTPPLSNLIRIFKNDTSPTEGYAVIVHDVQVSMISLTSPFPWLVLPTTLPGALQIVDVIYQSPYLIFTAHVSPEATSGTWFNTRNGQVGTATLSSRRCFSSFYHPTLNTLYWGCLGGFLWNSATNRPIDSGGNELPTFVAAGAGNFTTGYLYTPENRLYLGSSIGLGLSIDLTTNTIVELFFTFGSNTLSHLTSVFMDTTGTSPVLFWGTSDGRVVRSNTRNFKTIFASASLPAPERLSSAFGNAGKLYFGYGYDVGIATSNTNYHTWALTKSNCSSYSCSTCLGAQLIDKEYCGMCIDTGICSSQSDCSGSSWTQTGFCPSADSVSLAQTGSISGGTLSQFNGAYFKSDAGDLAFYKCGYFSGSTEVNVSADALDVGYVQCKSPSWSAAETVGVRVYYKNRIWAGDWSFSYYDCLTTTSCSSCGTAQTSECGWCFETNQCASHEQCGLVAPPYWRRGYCPTVMSIPPTNVSTSDSALVLTVPVKNFLAPRSTSYSLTCTIDSITSEAVGLVGSGTSVTAINCPFDPTTFTVGPSGQVFYTISIGTSQDMVINYGTTPQANLELYHCPSMSICVDCRSPQHSRCTWCSTITPQEGYCDFVGACSATVTACTSISAINGDISRLSEDQARSTILTITGSNMLKPGNTGPTLCQFTMGDTIWNSTYTYRDSKTVTCPMPIGITKGQYSLALYRGTGVLTNSLPLEIYSCADRTTCGTCISMARGDVCEWCATTSNPGCVESTVSCPNVVRTDPSLCPAIYEAAPNLFSVLGAPNMTLVGPHRIPENEASSARCRISQAPNTWDLSLRWLNDTAVSCDNVPAITAGNAEVTIVSVSGATIAGSVEILFAECSEFTDCDQCMGSPYSFCTWCGATCEETCAPELTHEACPTFDYMTPNYSIQTGGDRVSIYGSNFLLSAKRASLYQCVWDASTRTEVSVETTSVMSCLTPARSLLDVAPLTIEFGGKPYLTTTGVEVFSCVAPVATACQPQCAERPHCGWCLATQNCGSESQCDAIGSQWLSLTCPFAILDSASAPLEGNFPITALLSRPLPPETGNSEVTCSFGPFSVASEVFHSGNFTAGTGSTQVKCLTPAVAEPFSTTFGIQYRSEEYISPVPFKYVDCSTETDCTGCIAIDSCGWCSAGSHCTFQTQCTGSDAKWSKDKCPVNKVALGVGLGVGLFALLLLILLAIFLIRRARKRRGLLIELKEPNYAEIAWGNDVTLAWKVPEHEYKLLELGLSRRDFLLQLAIAFNCPATEQDAMAKALVFVAHKHGLADDAIQKCIRFEVQICKHENTLFRNNSVASKMYKFFSRIVGVKYLFHGIARVILELEILGRQQTAKARKGSSSGSNEVSLLSMSMELDQTKALDGDDLDTDTNLLQLQLICQKLLNVLVKTNLKEIPAPFRKIFIEIDNSIMAKFAGSNDAVYKGIGGLYFLRFVCPAITAPHVYGLLESPPNNVTQRQLVLISKVIQNIANMQPPGKKEQYMTALNDFIVQSIPKIIKFYDNLRMAVNVRSTEDSEEQPLEVPDEVRLNSLAALWNFLYTAKPKIEAWLESEDCLFEESEKASLKEILDECAAEYTSAPKKLRASSAAANESSTKKKKKKKTT